MGVQNKNDHYGFMGLVLAGYRQFCHLVLFQTLQQKHGKKDDDSSFNSPSRVSFGGVYLTDNLLLARSSASNATSKNEKIQYR